MGITHIYLRNKVQLMIGRRTSVRVEGEEDKIIKQLSSREQGYREQARKELKIKEARKNKENI